VRTKEISKDRIQEITLKLLDHCKRNGWAGYDPYDGLNSKVFQSLRFLQNRYTRLALIQFMKRSPLNFRWLLRVPKTQNPKGMALFLTSVMKLSRFGLITDSGLMRTLLERLISLSSLKTSGHIGWGYNFDWQALTGFEPYGTPNIICTTFAGNALLDAYKHFPELRLLEMAESAARFIRNCLYVEIDSSQGFFDYTPGDRKTRIPIHNANLLGAAFLARAARMTARNEVPPEVLKAVRFSVANQHDDGSWDYGECDRPSQRWIDNFHTGFNLCALRSIGNDLETTEFEPYIGRGFRFYREHFFCEDGAPKYYHDRLYPIDIHSAAQSIITFATLHDLNRHAIQLAHRVLCWTIKNMYKAQDGYFFFQKHRWWTTKIDYTRWSQAWMLLALGTLQESYKEQEEEK